jgi:hypothetical protein
MDSFARREFKIKLYQVIKIAKNHPKDMSNAISTCAELENDYLAIIENFREMGRFNDFTAEIERFTEFLEQLKKLKSALKYTRASKWKYFGFLKKLFPGQRSELEPLINKNEEILNNLFPEITDYEIEPNLSLSRKVILPVVVILIVALVASSYELSKAKKDAEEKN